MGNSMAEHARCNDRDYSMATAANGQIRALAVVNTGIVEEVRIAHKCCQ